MCLLAMCMSSLEKCLGLSVFDWVVCFLDIDLHKLFVILENNSLLVGSFTNTFSHFVGYLFALFMVFFAV